MAVGEVEGLQGEVHRDHGQHAGEQVQNHREVHQGLAHLKAHDRHGVGHHEHEEGGHQAGDAGDLEGVPKPGGELVDRVGLEQLQVVLRAPLGGEEGAGVHAGVGAEGGAHQPDNGNEPENGQGRDENVE